MPNNAHRKGGPKPRNNLRSGSSETMDGSGDYEPPVRRSGRARNHQNHENPHQVTPQFEKSSGPGIRGRQKNSSEDQPLKRRLRGPQKRIEDYDDEYLNSPMNEDELAEWKGWCEIESDPAFFNSILRDWGVKGVKIQEVISLDDELIMMIPKPIYGLIFLFEYREDSPEKMEKCPDDVWFAHQVAQNSCASVALLNLIMNISDLDIGESIEDLKQRTSASMNPNQRGQAIRNCEFVRKVHNSFARKSDLFTVVKDLKQPQKPATPTKAGNKCGNKGGKRKGKGFTNKKRKKGADDDEENAYHFIAFVPINGKLWKLDGLDALPMNLGSFENDWMDLARPEITARMAAYENEAISFSLQALCSSPLATIPTLLAENIVKLISLESTLNSKDPDWAVYVDPESSMGVATQLLLGPDAETCVTPELLDRAKSNLESNENSRPKITNPEHTVLELMDMREKVVREQNSLRGAYMEEIISQQQEEERTKARRRSPEDDRGTENEKSSPKVSTPKDSSSKEPSPSSDKPEQANGNLEDYDRHRSPVAEHMSTSSPLRDNTSSKATTPPVDDTESRDEEMKDAVDEKQGSESSLDIPLDDALTIHSAGSPR